MRDMGDNHFKVGDRARAIKDCYQNDFHIAKGGEYTVTNVSEYDYLQLEGAPRHHGHPASEFELVRSAEEPASSKGASYVEIRTLRGRTSNYLIDLAEVSTKMEPIRSLEYLLHSSKFIRVSDKAGTEKLIAVDTIEEARVL